MTSLTKQHKEMNDIVLAKGVGILLVVIGHILSRGTSDGNEWFSILVTGIYIFHMPFFMALSGFVFFRKGRVEKLYEGYKTFITKQFIRLILPFFGLGMLIIFGKLVMHNIAHVDNVPSSFILGLKGLFWETSHSPSISIWYIYALFIYTALTPVLFRFTKHSFMIALTIGLLLYMMPSVNYLYLDKLAPFYLFFIVGGILRKYEENYIKAIDGYAIWFMILFILGFFLYTPDLPEYSHVKFIVGLLSIPAIHALCRILEKHGSYLTKLFYILGQSSYFIYLFNTICIGLSKAVIFKVTHWHGMNFLFIAPILIFAGIIGPMIIERIFSMCYAALHKNKGLSR